MDARAAESLLSLAEEASPGLRGPGAKAALEHLENEYSDLLAALQWFIDGERTDDALRLANALYRFWITKQRFDEFDRARAEGHAMAASEAVDFVPGARSAG